MTTQTLPLRNEVPEHLTWDLTTIYPTEAAWEADFARLSDYPDKLASFKGRMRRSGKLLLQAIKLDEECSQIIGKLYNYAHLHSDEDTANSHYKALVDRCIMINSQLSAAGSYMIPELLSIKPERLEKFIKANPELEAYRHFFANLTRKRDHVRSPEVEELLSHVEEISEGPSTIFGQIDNADLKLPVVNDEDGKAVQLSHGVYTRLMESENRDVRKAAMQGMMNTFIAMRNTVAATYSAQVKMNIFQARSRRYNSVVEKELANINAPLSVYDSLIETVQANLPLLQRYLQLRKRILKLDELHWYDLYAPIVHGVDAKIEYAAAQETVLAAVAPLGSDYVEALRKGFNSRWIDVVESKGKRSGAYSSGTYGTNPFILLNWQGDIESMFTLAHEAGHTMHSFFTRLCQPFHYSHYTLFVAEVASTTNEALLAAYLLKHTTDPQMRLYILNKQLESIRRTLIRQTLFAEFEREAHRLAENGQPLTPDVLCKIHKGLNDKYYGPACIVDPEIEIEWARIPHFYNSFYVYQYSTGISAATALSRQILTEGQPAVDRYREFLRSGSSDYSINLLKKAGVDLSTPTPIQLAFDDFAANLSLFEEELAKLS